MARPMRVGGEMLTIEGLDEARRALRRMEDLDGIEDLKDAFQRAASVVVADARNRASGVSALAAKAAATLRAGRQAAQATVSLGGASTPFALGAEFGAMRGQRRRNVGGNPRRAGRGWNQFMGWRGNADDTGYFLFPAVRGKTDEIIDMVADDIEKIFGRA